jgi:phosphoglycerol transferase MdoB-like AlkP superfamily enzyme
MHTAVGLGNTSDAEFVVNTGYYPLGDVTIVWEANDNPFYIQSLPKMFTEGYNSFSYNPTIEDFYAHKNVHENFYNFDQFKGYESFERKYHYDSYLDLYLHKKWVSDKAILEFALEDGKKTIEDEKNFYIFAQTITPHYPFVDLEAYQDIKFRVSGASKKFNNYLSQVSYIDKILYDFIKLAEKELLNTVFIIYGDHGNALPKSDYEALYGRKLTDFQYRKLLLEIPFIIYDPSGKINNYVIESDLNIEKISNRTLSQIDIFSTIKSLYNLSCDYTLGVNAFSNQKSFALDPKNLDLITDLFIYNFKNSNYNLYSNIEYKKMIDIANRVKELKIANDIYLSKKIGGKS